MTNPESLLHIDDLLTFMDSSPVNFYAVDTVRRRLDEEDYIRLDQSESWNIEAGGKYYVIKNDSAIFAFEVGNGSPDAGFKIISAHSDSPGFRIKPRPEIVAPGNALKINTEVYGGPILYTWFDRPLSIAGRVVTRSDNPLRPDHRLINFERPLMTIPHLAIHFNRSVNEGNPLSKQKDMLPVLALVNDTIESKGYLLDMVADELGIDSHDILDFDLSLYDVSHALLLGANDEFVSSGRLDDLSMVHASMTALLQSEQGSMTRVMAIFDNEETGSGTKQGAASPELDYILRRICAAFGGNEEDYLRAVAKSFMVSADNAHGIHPNYPEKQDPTNHPALGGGPVVKINANCKYMTDADSAAVFKVICEQAGVPCQYFVNHSDVAGGSTLGNILTSQIPLRGVDMGAALWAMHSVRETASALDHEYIISAFTQFYNC